jgi:hypothetical protein
MLDEIREDEISHNTQIKAIADFLQKVFTQQQQQQSKNVRFKTEQQHSDGENHTASSRKRRLTFAPSPETVYESLPSTSTSTPPIQDVFYETPKKTGADIPSDDDVDVATDMSPEIEEHVRKFGRENFGELTSPYLTPYVYNKPFVDKQYEIRKETDGTFMIGNAPLSVDNDSNITIYGRQYSGTKGLWELLTRKNVYKNVITAHDMKTYKSILQFKNAHLEEYELSDNI